MTFLPILDPLNTATRDALEPLKLRSDDRLKISLSEIRGKDWFHFEPIKVDSNGEEDTRRWGSWEARTWGCKIPERHKGDANTHFVGVTDLSVLMVHCVWPRDRLRFGTHEANLTYHYLLRRFLQQNIRSSLQARFKISEEIPDMPDVYVEHPEWPLLDYQKAAFAMCYKQEATALFMDRGTGKTCVAINRFCAEANVADHMYRVLVVCPKKARLNWQREIAKFAFCKGKTLAMRGTPIKRLQGLGYAMRREDGCEFTVVITSYDNVTTDIGYLEKCDWDLVIADESHYFKNESTGRWKAMKKIRDASKRRMCLTGTPISNSLLDIFTQFEFLGDGQSGFTTSKSFREYHGKYENNEATGQMSLVGLENIPLLQERLARMTFSITKQEAGLNLPDKVYSTYEITMTDNQNEVYDGLVRDLAYVLDPDGANDVISATHILTQLLRLTQITSGFVKYDEEWDDNEVLIKESRIQRFEKNPKIDAVEDLIREDREDPNSKTIIWAIYIEDIKMISERLEEMGEEYVVVYSKIKDSLRDEAEWRFNNDDKCKIFVAHPRAAGDSLTLLGYNAEKGGDTYCDHEIYYSHNWSMIDREQSEDRAHRIGTKRTVRITDLVVPNKIDQEIRRRVNEKKDSANEISDIRSLLHRVLEME